MVYRNNEVWCAIYVRLSEEDRDKRNEEDDSQSIQNQKSMLKSYAETNGWHIYKVYSDDDYAGSDRKRPAFNELLKDAEEKKFSIVLCKSQSRFTRELELVEHYLHDLFPQWGIRFVGIVDNADTANKGNKKARQINGLVNEWYLEDLSENIKETLKDRHEKGFFTGSFAPYGYRKDPDFHGHLLPDPEAAEVVHRIFDMFSKGMGKTSIARQLNAEGIPNATEYKRLHGIQWKRNSNKRSTLWQYFSIADILTNEVYIGNLVQGKSESISYKSKRCRPIPKENWIRVENTHAPIVERELWDAVQKQIENKAKAGWTGEIGMFAGKTKCMYCGYTMRSAKHTDGRRYLECSSRHIMDASCRGGFIGQKELENTVLEELKKMIGKYLDLDSAEQQLRQHNEAEDRERERKNIKKSLAQLQSMLDNSDKALQMLYMDRVQGIVTPQEYIKLSDGFKREMSQHNANIQVLRDKLAALDSENSKETSRRDILMRMANISELDRATVNCLIDFIEIGRREGHYRHAKVPIVIHWNF